MTVRQLITELETYDDNLLVCRGDSEWEGFPITETMKVVGNEAKYYQCNRRNGEQEIPYQHSIVVVE